MKTKRMTLRAVGLLLTAIMVISAIPATALTASADAPSVELSDPEVVIEIHVTPEPDEEPVESPGFDVKVDNWGGSGTEEDPFTIHNRVGLENLAMISERGYSFSGIYFALTGDFSIETPVIGAQYSFIGSEDVPFAGVFDGRGHTISGFNYSDGGNRVGLFRVVTGTVKNLNVSGSVTGSGGGANVGGIAGKNYGTIRDCTFSGTVTATGRDSYVGGIAGQNTGLILGCTNYAEINNTNGYGDTGGIAGNSKDGSIDRSRNEGNVTGRGRAGGISAAIERYRTAKTRITGLSNVGEISGANYVGGLFGYMYRFDVDGSTNSGTIYAKQYVGGIVGHSEYSYLSNCSNSGDLDTKTSGALRSWGGIAGKYDAPKLWNCCNTGNIDPYTDRDRSPDSENFGGIVGELTDQSNTTVTGCYNLGRVWSYIDGGGIVGDARRATISNCFNAGRIHVANKYYDVEGDSGGGICGFAERVVIKECGNGGDIFAEKYAGGIVGYTRICQLYDCYNAGTVYATEIAGGIAGWFVNSSLWRSISIGYINAAQNEKTVEDFLNYLFLQDGNWPTDTDPEFGAVIGKRTNNTTDPDVLLTLSRNYYYQYTNEYSYKFHGVTYHYSCPAEGIREGNATDYNDSQIRGLSEYEYRYRPDEDIYVTWDFADVWYMTDYGPRLRHVGPDTEDSVIRIRTAEDLVSLADTVNAGIPLKNVTVRLEADIDLSEYENWVPIGSDKYTAIATFSGVFEGGNHTISGLTIDTNDRLAALFGNVDGGTIRNLKLTGSVNGDLIVAGIAGYVRAGTVENCYVSLSALNGKQYMGGLVAVASHGTVIRNCSYSGDVIGTTDKEKLPEPENEGSVGGLVGYMTLGCLLERCSFEGGKVQGTDATGGLVGKMENSTVENCIHRSGDVKAPEGMHVGGIVGYAGTGSVVNYCCHSAGDVSGMSYVGGVAGRAFKETASGIGIGSGTTMKYWLKNCYYLSGTVTAAGGLRPDTTDRGIGVSSGSIIGWSTDDSNPSGVAEPLTADQLRTQSKFKNWDFENVWSMGGDNPELVTVRSPVTFEANGGSGTMNRFFTPALGGKLPACTFTRSGYRFLGWNTASDASGTFYADKQYVDGLTPLTLYAVWAVSENVGYVDASGSAKTANNCLGIHSGLVILRSGWYFVDGTVRFNKRIEIRGDVNIILKDGSSLNAPRGVHVPTDSTLTVWGQSGKSSTPYDGFTTQGTGKLTAYGNDGDSGVGGNAGETPGDIRFNGGSITSSAYDGAGIGGAKSENGGFVTLNNCRVTASSSGAAAIGGGDGGDGGTVVIRNSYVSAVGGITLRKIGDYYKSYSCPGIGAGVPEVKEDGDFDELNGVSISIDNSYVHAEAGRLEESSTVDARAIGTSLVGDYNLKWIGSLTGVRCEYEGVPVEFERIPYFCTKHSADIMPCTMHAGRADDHMRCRYCNADLEKVATLVVCDYNYSGCPEPFSYGADGSISFTVTDRISVPSGSFFREWNTAKDGSGTSYSSGDTFTAEGKITLWAQWGAYKSVNYTDENGGGHTVTATVLTEKDTVLKDGWYVCEGSLTFGNRITVNGDVRLILSDGCTLTANSGIGVPVGNSLTVYGQSTRYSVPGESVRTIGTGVLYAKSGGVHNAAIGGNSGAAAGTVTINGGVVTAEGRFGAGIGGGDVGTCGTVNVKGGCVTASGGRGSAGIGGGGYTSGGAVNISGGFVRATGSIYSDSGQAAPGIGSGRPRKDGSQPLLPGTVKITGGTVIAVAGTAPEGGVGAQAIGVNLADAANATAGTLTISDGLRVTAGDGADTAALSLYGNRVSACRERYARIEPCAEHTPDAHRDPPCIHCGEDFTVGPLFLWHSLSLDGDVGVNYYLNLTDEQAKAATVLFTLDVNGEKKIAVVDMSGASKTDLGYRATCRVAPAEMTCEITASVEIDGVVQKEVDVYSAAGYANAVLTDGEFAESFVQSENAEGRNGVERLEQLRVLVAEMLNYGAAAQEQFGINVTDLANAGLDARYAPADVDADGISVTADDMTAGLGEYGLVYSGSSLVCRTTTLIRHYYRVTDPVLFAAVSDGVTVDGRQVGYGEKGGKIYFEIADISAADLDRDYTLTIGSTGYKYSAMDYVKRAIGSDAVDPSVKTLAKALFRYGQAANAYFGR